MVIFVQKFAFEEIFDQTFMTGALHVKTAFEYAYVTLVQAVHPLRTDINDPNVHRYESLLELFPQ